MQPTDLIEFPKWKYSAERLDGVLVNDPDQEAALGEGYFDNPALIVPADKKKK